MMIFLLATSICLAFASSHAELEASRELDRYLAEARTIGRAAASAAQRPVVLVPGLAGTRLRYSFDHPPIDPSVFCSNHSAGEDAWVVLSSIVPVAAKCVMSRLQMRFDGTEWVDFPKVDVSVVPGLAGIAYLDPSDKLTRKVTKYFAGIIEALEAAGYQEGKNMEGLGYDWRKGGGPSLNAWRKNLTNTVERMVAQYGRKVVLVSHSMGCMETNLWLNMMNSTWKDAHIHKWIAAGGPFLGAPKVLKGLLSGDNLGIVSLPSSDAHILQANSGASMFTMPFPVSEWEQPVLTGGSTLSVMATQLPQFMSKIGYDAPYSAERTSFSGVMGDPLINTTLVVGSQLDTCIGVAYPTPDFTQKPSLKMGLGDSTVPLVSSTYPRGRWSAVDYVDLGKTSHQELIQNPTFYQMVLKAASE